jgi:multifunctional beta-oxidation protein
VDVKLTPEAVASKWDQIINFDDGRADHPEDGQDGLKSIMNNMNNKAGGTGGASGSGDGQYLKAIEEAKKAKAEGTVFEYDDRDVILYSK